MGRCSVFTERSDRSHLKLDTFVSVKGHKGLANKVIAFAYQITNNHPLAARGLLSVLWLTIYVSSNLHLVSGIPYMCINIFIGSGYFRKIQSPRCSFIVLYKIQLNSVVPRCEYLTALFTELSGRSISNLHGILVNVQQWYKPLNMTIK